MDLLGYNRFLGLNAVMKPKASVWGKKERVTTVAATPHLLTTSHG